MNVLIHKMATKKLKDRVDWTDWNMAMEKVLELVHSCENEKWLWMVGQKSTAWYGNNPKMELRCWHCILFEAESSTKTRTYQRSEIFLCFQFYSYIENTNTGTHLILLIKSRQDELLQFIKVWTRWSLRF